jgi:hypothetical protein
MSSPSIRAIIWLATEGLWLLELLELSPLSKGRRREIAEHLFGLANAKEIDVIAPGVKRIVHSAVSNNTLAGTGKLHKLRR